MRRLIGLYPRAWRERYAAEFDDLLNDRPATFRDQLDIVAGALDAWIHPQVARREVDPAERSPLGRRVATAGAALAGGALLIGGGVVLHTAPIMTVGYKDSMPGVILLFGGLTLIALAAMALGSGVGSKPMSNAAAAMLVGGLLTATPWPFPLIGFYTFLLANVALGVHLWKARHRVVGALIVVPGLVMTSFNTEDERALLTIPFAIAWMLVAVAGLRPASSAAHPGPIVAVDPAGP